MKKVAYLLCFVFFNVACEALLIEDITESVVVLLAPAEDVEVQRGSVQFNWEEVLDAESYKIQIANPDFDTAKQIVLDSIVSSIFFTKNIDSGAYEWRVKAMNSGYETNYTTHSFKVN